MTDPIEKLMRERGYSGVAIGVDIGVKVAHAVVARRGFLSDGDLSGLVQRTRERVVAHLELNTGDGDALADELAATLNELVSEVAP